MANDIRNTKPLSLTACRAVRPNNLSRSITPECETGLQEIAAVCCDVIQEAAVAILMSTHCRRDEIDCLCFCIGKQSSVSIDNYDGAIVKAVR